jgi:NADH-quinone oxidoreductase subunit D
VDDALRASEKHLVYTEIESLVNHFKLIMEGPQVPAGEVYSALGSAQATGYLVSAGAAAHKCAFAREASHMGSAAHARGHQLADIIPTFGSVNMRAGV